MDVRDRPPRFWWWVLCAYAGCLTVIGLIAAGLFYGLPPADVATVERIVVARVPVLVVAAFVLLAICGGAISWLYSQYHDAAASLAEQIDVVLSANPSHRINVAGGKELIVLGAAIDRLAENGRRVSSDAEVHQIAARARLEEERDQLATLMAELAQPVLVANAEGQVLLYNERARVLFARIEPQMPLGLGRSVYGLIDQRSIGAAARVAKELIEAGHVRPVVPLDAHTNSGSPVRGRLSPTFAIDGALRALVFVLEDEGGTTVVPAQLVSTPERPVFYDFALIDQSHGGTSLDDRRLASLLYTAFDTETTGLHPSEGDEIISIGAVRIVNGRMLRHEVFDRLVDPRRKLDPASARIHGIKASALVGQAVIDEVLPLFHRFCEDTVLVAHNAAFDMRFFELKATRTGTAFTQPVLDTMLLAEIAQPGLGSTRMEAIAERLGVKIVGRHTALGDAMVAGEVFLLLLPLLAARGIYTLGQALEASRSAVRARLEY